MKTIRIYDMAGLRWDKYNYCFRCKQTNCDICNLKFICFTNGNVVNILDKYLVEYLHKQSWYKVREKFFKRYENRKS